MIISHARRFIFVKTYKTAGSSLEIALSKYCARGDILTPLDGDEEAQRRELSGLGARNYGKPARRYRIADVIELLRKRRPVERYSEHSPAWQIRRMIGPETWERYFTFTIVRNPYDRCLSRFYYSRKVEETRGRKKAWNFADLDQYMRYNPWFINENWAMYTQDDRMLVDFVVRYEHLEADLAEVSRRIGLERNLYDDMRSISAKRGIRPADQHSARLSAAGREMVGLLCAPEIEMFGYRPEGVAAAEAAPGPAVSLPGRVTALVSAFLPALAALNAVPL
jgi:hypothetical protein